MFMLEQERVCAKPRVIKIIIKTSLLNLAYAGLPNWKLIYILKNK